MNYRYSAPGQNTAAGGEMENLEERSWIMNPTGHVQAVWRSGERGRTRKGM